MRSAPLSRRAFTSALAVFASTRAGRGQSPAESHLGSLYPSVQNLADSSSLELSFLRPEFRDLKAWQTQARKRIFDLLLYSPARVTPDAEILSSRQREGYREERLTFRTTPQFRVPAHILIPDGAPGPRPAVVLMHDHGGFYLWGREKVVANDNEHPSLTGFKQQYYAGRSIGAELARKGYVVITIDMFYWGERRLILGSAPPELGERSAAMTDEQVNSFNSWAGKNEQLMARSLLTAGITWPGITVWDDIRTLDYLVSRPEVDRTRLFSLGLSVGGYRSFLLAALDPRIKAAVDVCWMTMYAAQIENHVINTMGEAFVIPGMYRYLDLPDLAAAIAPRALMLIMGSRDGLFPPAAMQGSFDKIGRCYEKAKAPHNQLCRLFDSPHEFNLDMQSEVWNWLRSQV
jgi:dienelactone hydrolase